jgi:hypothetical protein
MVIMERVTISGATPVSVMMRPLIRPMTTPSTSTSRMASGQGTSNCDIMMPQTTT